MKILLLVDDYMPESIKIAAVMMHDLAKEFQRLGHDVTVCTPSPSLESNFQLDFYDDIKVLKFKSGEIKNISKIKRAINETLLSIKAWRYLKSYFNDNRCDLVVYYSPTIFFGGLVSKLKTHWRCRSFLVLRDFFPQWAVDNNLIKDESLIHKYFRYFEGLNYKAADVIAVQSPSNKLYFEKKYKTLLLKHELTVLYNWCNTEDISSKINNFRVKLGLTDKVIFFYGGNIGHAQDMMNIVRMAHALENYPSAHFLLVGKGDEVELVLSYIEEQKLTNITYMPSVSQKEYNDILMHVDIGLFSLHRDHKTHNFPGKLLGYMKYSIPILGSVNSGNDLSEVLGAANAGLVSVNGSDDEFVNNAVQLLESNELRVNMGKNANQLLSDTFSVGSAASKIISMCHT